LWDACLDSLPDVMTAGEGREVEGRPVG